MGGRSDEDAAKRRKHVSIYHLDAKNRVQMRIRTQDRCARCAAYLWIEEGALCELCRSYNVLPWLGSLSPRRRGTAVLSRHSKHELLFVNEPPDDDFMPHFKSDSPQEQRRESAARAAPQRQRSLEAAARAALQRPSMRVVWVCCLCIVPKIYMSLLYIQFSRFAHTSLDVEHLKSGAS